MIPQKLLNITNKISEFHYWLIGYVDEMRKDEMDLLNKLERNIKSMRAIVEKHRKRGGKREIH